MTRAVWLTFFGEYRGEGHPHESPKVMTIPLWILAGMAVVVGLHQPPGEAGPGELRAPLRALRRAHLRLPDGRAPRVQLRGGRVVDLPGAVRRLPGLAVLRPQPGPARPHAAQRPGRQGLRVPREQVLPRLALREASSSGQHQGPDRPGLSTGSTSTCSTASSTAPPPCPRASVAGSTSYIDQGAVDRFVNASGAGAEGSGQILRHMQTGRVQQYAALLFAGAAVLAGIFIVII